MDLQEEHKEIQANGNGGTNLTWTEVSHMPYTNKVRSSSILIITFSIKPACPGFFNLLRLSGD